MAAKDADKEITEDSVVDAAEKKPAKKAAKKATAPKADAKAADDAKADVKPAKKSAAKKADSEAADSKPAKKTAAKKADETAAEAKPAKKPAKKAAPAKDSAPKGVTEGQGGLLKAHHLRPAPGAHTAKTRVGRGEGSKGKTAGRGTKGTKARYQVPARFEGGQTPMHMRLPKLRGFKNPFRTEYQVVNLAKLAELFPEGGSVTVSDLVAKGAVRKGQLVKVLGAGDISVALAIEVDACSTSAREKILAAGGSIVED